MTIEKKEECITDEYYLMNILLKPHVFYDQTKLVEEMLYGYLDDEDECPIISISPENVHNLHRIERKPPLYDESDPYEKWDLTLISEWLVLSCPLLYHFLKDIGEVVICCEYGEWWGKRKNHLIPNSVIYEKILEAPYYSRLFSANKG